MLECHAASLQVNGRELLCDISLQLVPGEMLALIGPNGAGKSSLLRILSGEWRPGSGEVRLNELPLDAWTRRELALQRAVMSQADRLDFPFTATEVVTLGRTPHRASPAQDTRIAQAALEAVAALPLARRLYTTLSGGERQRVQLARALAQIWQSGPDQPRYLLLDEPTASLDLAHQHGMLQLLNRLTLQGIGILIVLHDLNLAARYADRVALLSAGRLAACGRPTDVMQPEVLSRIYGLPLRALRVESADYPLFAAG